MSARHRRGNRLPSVAWPGRNPAGPPLIQHLATGCNPGPWPAV